MTYSATAISLAMDQFETLTIIKTVSYVFYLFFNITSLVTNFPIIGSALYPVWLAGTFGRVTYADLTTLLLFKFVGTSFDPTNPFCNWMFFIIPAYRTIDNYLTFLVANWSTFSLQITTASTPGGMAYSIYYAVAAAYLGFRFNLGQLLIGARTFYPEYFM